MSRNQKARLRRQTIGYVFQDFNLLAGLTAAENVSLPLELDGTPARRRASRRWPRSTSSAWPSAGRTSPTSRPGASANAWRSPVPSSESGASCSPTSPRVRSTPRTVKRSCGWSWLRAVAVSLPSSSPTMPSWRHGPTASSSCAMGASWTRPCLPRTRVPPRAHVIDMTTVALDRPTEVASGGSRGRGGVPARRAMVRWTWRLFRREWRQQLLIVTLITVAVAATIIGAAVAVNTPPPKNAGFGTANHMITIPGRDQPRRLILSCRRRPNDAISIWCTLPLPARSRACAAAAPIAMQGPITRTLESAARYPPACRWGAAGAGDQIVSFCRLWETAPERNVVPCGPRGTSATRLYGATNEGNAQGS